MIDLMKKSVLVLLVGLFLVSCGEKDPEPEVDFREQAVGSYSINLEYVDASGNQFTDNFTARIELSGENNLVLTGDGEEDKLIGVREASNGLVFNIENDNFTDDNGNNISIRGTKSVSLDGDDYDGTYDSDNGELYFQVEYFYVNRDLAEFDALVVFSGFKN